MSKSQAQEYAETIAREIRNAYIDGTMDEVAESILDVSIIKGTDDVARDYDEYIVHEGCAVARFDDVCEADDYMRLSGLIPLDRLEGYTSRDAYEIHETTDGTLLEIHAAKESE